MLTHPTLDQLRALKLDGMVQAFVELEAQEQARNLAHAEWLALLLDREAADRNTRRFQTRLRTARLRHSQAAIEDVDYRTPLRGFLFQAKGRGNVQCLITAGQRPVLVRATSRTTSTSREAASAHHARWPMQGCASHLPDTLSRAFALYALSVS